MRDTLLAEEVGFVLAHATRLRAIAEANYKKDEIDAELLARMRIAGCIPEVHAKGPAQRELALVVRHRAWLVRNRTALVNRMQAQLHAVGLRLERGRLLTKKGQRWVRETAWASLRPEQRRLIATHVRIIRGLQGMVRGLDRRIRHLARRNSACALLQTIPGIGSYRALLIAAEVQPIRRFQTSDRLVSYAGLAPTSSSSGLRGVRVWRSAAAPNRWLRGAFVHAIVSHVQHAPDSWLTHNYMAQKQRLGWRVARIAAARKLARAVHSMLRTGEAWRNERDVRSALHFTNAARRPVSF